MYGIVANELPSATYAVQVAFGAKRSGKNALGIGIWRTVGWFFVFTLPLLLLPVNGGSIMPSPASPSMKISPMQR
jgi:hypothetical protein